MSDRNITLSCKGVWKLFGDKSDAFLSADNAAPSPTEIMNAGLIGAVKDASFDIYQGEIFIIMGLSGSGKSTLVRCLSRLIEPTAGQVLFDGEDLLAMSDQALIDVRRHKMGMVFQHFALLPHLTVLDNVAFPLLIQGVDKSERDARALKVIELVGLAGREAYYPRELSGGQQQRVGIARSLAVEPEIWFLDEPFSALDPLIRREMQDEFLRLQNVLKKTIVFITHDFDEAIRLADRIAIMQDGAIVQIGTPEELVLHPATDYVAEFTQEISRAKVLTAKSIMIPLKKGDTPPSFSKTVRGDLTIQAFAGEAVHDESAIGVVNSHDDVIGSLEPKAIIEVLVEGNASGAFVLKNESD